MPGNVSARAFTGSFNINFTHRCIGPRCQCERSVCLVAIAARTGREAANAFFGRNVIFFEEVFGFANLVGQNEFDGLELKIFKRIAKEFTMRRSKFSNHDCEVRVIKNTAEEILHVSAKVLSLSDGLRCDGSW